MSIATIAALQRVADRAGPRCGAPKGDVHRCGDDHDHEGDHHCLACRKTW